MTGTISPMLDKKPEEPKAEQSIEEKPDYVNEDLDDEIPF